MHQGGLTFFQRIGGIQKIVGGHSLQHESRSLLIVDSIGNLDQAVGGNAGILRIAAEHHGVGHPISDLHVGYVGADRNHLARSFLPRHKRDDCFVAAFAVVNINEVDACGRNLYDRVTALGLRNRKFNLFHYLRTAYVFYLNRLHNNPQL